MPPLLDLSAIEAVARPIVDHDGREWLLRDRVPAEAMLRGFDLMALDEAIANAVQDSQQPFVPSTPLGDDATPEQIATAREEFRQRNTEQRVALQQAYADRLALITELATVIFQASYPDADDLLVTRVLPTYQDRRVVVDYFFVLLFFGSSGPLSASTTPAAPTTPDAPSSEEETARPSSPSAQPLAAAASTTPTTPTRPTTRSQPQAQQKPQASTASPRPTSTRPTAAGRSTARKNSSKAQAKSQPQLRPVPKPAPRPTAQPA